MMGSSNDTIMSVREWATWMGWASAGMAYQAKKEGRLVLTDDGKAVLAEASKKRYLATSDPSKRGVTDRHAAARSAPPPEPPEQQEEEAPQDDAPEVRGYDYQSSKAKREHWAAEREHAQYRKEAGELIEVTEHVSVYASAGALMRASLEAWVSVLPPQLVGRDESVIRSTLADQVEQVLREMSRKIGDAAASLENDA